MVAGVYAQAGVFKMSHWSVHECVCVCVFERKRERDGVCVHKRQTERGEKNK